MANYKERICKLSGFVWKQYNSFQKCPCDDCKATKKPRIRKPIKKVSDKRKIINKEYETIRIQILTEAHFKCFVDGCHRLANTIEHTAGRIGFYDDWARLNNIPLIIDKRFLKPCCLHHNLEFENNPELSKQYQISKISGKPKE